MKNEYVSSAATWNGVGGFKKIIALISIVSMVLSSVAGIGISPAQAINPLSVSTNLDGTVKVNPANGFPMWYADSLGKRLQPCLGISPDGSGPADPNCVVLPDAGYDGINPISFPTNFPGEFFYYLADANQMSVGPNLAGKAKLRMALEGSFTAGSPAVGQQISFIRINLQQILNLTPTSTYTVTYPFGTFTFTTDAAGKASASGGTAFRAEDGPGAAGDFTILLPATATNLTKFLAAVSPVAPAGYLGNPGVLQTIGAGTNPGVFKIVGPNIGGIGINTVSTNLWNVAGKIAAPVLNSITVTPAAPSVPANTAQQFTAAALDQFAAPMIPATPITWTSSNPAVGTINLTTGLFNALAIGTTTITASSGGVSGSTLVTVTAAPSVLTSIKIVPSAPSMAYGLTKQFTAIQLDQFGNQLVAPAAVTWSSSNAAVATINPATGMLTALSAGSATITAISGLISSSTPLTVTPPVPAPLHVALNLDGTTRVGANGFPTWYGDIAGTRLQPCLGTNPDGSGPADGNCVLLADAGYNPANPVSFPTNFPGEFFYYIADSKPVSVGTIAGQSANLRMALEGSFAAGTPVAGQQITFIRINLQQMSGLAANSTYTVTYPFGTFAFTTNAAGIASAAGGQAYRAEDGPGTFTVLLPATATNVQKFLAAVAPAAPVGYLGNPAVAQTIGAGTNGAIFAIDGPNIGGAGVSHIETALWNVAGKILANTAPTIAPIAPQSVAQGGHLAVSAVATDAQADPITYSIAPITSIGNETAAVINPTTGAISWTPITTASTTVGTATFAVSASDGSATATTTLTVTVNPLVLTSIAIAPTAASVVVGGATTLSASGLDQLGAPMAPQPAMTWTSSNPLIANVSATGVVTGVAAGTATITATSGGITSNVSTITVTAPIAQVLTSIAITPSAVSLAVSAAASSSLTASARDQFGIAMATQPALTWTSSDPLVATVDPTTGAVTALAPGTTNITATSGQITSNISVVTVTAAAQTISSMNILPATMPNFFIGTSRQLIVNEFDQNLATITPASAVTWTSSNPSVASVNAATGLVTALTAGTFTITATSVLVPSVVAVTPLSTVLAPAAVSSVKVTPKPVSVAVGIAAQLSGIAVDGLGAPVVPAPAITKWTSSNNAVATVDNKGQVKGVAPGTALITAFAGTLTGTTTVTVISRNATPILSSITVSPANLIVRTAKTQQFTATALDQNGITLKTKPAMTWSSSNTAVGTINPSSGVFTALTAGVAVIRATSGTVSGEMLVTVIANPGAGYELTAIILDPENITVNALDTQQFYTTEIDQEGVATGEDLVGIWNSSDPLVGTVDPLTGLFTAISAGTTDITVTGEGVSKTTTITVVGDQGPVLTTIEIKPENSSLTVNATQQFDADARDQNGLKLNPHPSFVWESSNPLVGTINNEGMFTARSVGITYITAASDGVIGSSLLTVTPVPDTVAPEIILNGAETINVNVGTAYAEPGATATDNIDPSVTVVTTGTVNTDLPGTYIVTYTATDAASNMATATRTVVVTALPAIDPAAAAALTAAKAAAALLVPADYTDFAPVTAALALPEANTAEVTAKTTAINTAIAGLVPVPVVPGIDAAAAAALQSAKAAAAALAPASYTDFAPVTAALALPEANTAEVTAKTAAINTAIKGLVLVATIPTSDDHSGHGGGGSPLWVLQSDNQKALPSVPQVRLPEQTTQENEGQGTGGKNQPASPEPQKEVLGAKVYAEGSLIRTADKKIYVIKNGQRVVVRNLTELKRYAGKKITDIKDEVSGAKAYGEGSLIRGADKKIFVIQNGKKLHIKNQAELKKYAGKKIIEVSAAELAKY